MSIALKPIPTYYHYWGKAQQQTHKPQISSQKDSLPAPYHLLVYHCLDVAAVAYHLLNDDAAIMKDLSAYLMIEKHKLRPFLCFLIALHDLGKFAASFQGLYQSDDDEFLIKVNKELYPYNKKHDALGYCFYRNALLNDCFCTEQESYDIEYGLEVLFNCVLGHHGKPIQTYEAIDFDDLEEVGIDYEYEISVIDLQVARTWINDLKDLFDVELPIDLLASADWRTYAKHISWQLSGLTMLADWIGSDTAYFTYHNNVISLEDYWQQTKDIAKRSVADKGLLTSIPPLPFISVQHSFGFTPSPLQEWAQNVPLHSLPQLFILEDVTGSGKTEAALTLAHRLMATGEANGFYFGLPTTATSNAMFERIADFMPTLYDTQNTTPSLVLAHSSKNMNETFRRLVDNANTHHNHDISTHIESSEDRSKNINTSQQPIGDEISSQCHAWFASSNKRALLADIGIGTIDQALLAALPKKHQPLRLFGLHHKVLIFDEVHSADSYMFELLTSLLQVHLHQGGHAILLTATLSLDKREALAKLWLDKPASEHTSQTNDNTTSNDNIKNNNRDTHCKHFPLATQVTSHTELLPDNDIAPVLEAPIDSPVRVARHLAVDFLHSTDDVVHYIAQAAQSKQCAVWVRNTVSDAIKAYELVLQAGIPAEDIVLFHSRFTLINRQRIEKQVLTWFGKHSTPELRAGKVLIATQVFQESLDADADVMVSDLCPIDYLIQRAGRLHRHQRDATGARINSSLTDDNDSDALPRLRPAPKLMLFTPEFTEIPDDKWYASLFPKSQYVYQHVGQLWLTLRILNEQRCLDLPKDARLLIESVYSDEAQQLIPEALEPASKADVSQQQRKKYGAKDVLIDWTQGYSAKSQSRWFAGESTVNSEAGTRFQEMPTCEVVVLTLKSHTDNDDSSLPFLHFYTDSLPAIDQNPMTKDFAIELSTLKISETMANKLAELPSEYQAQITKLKERYPSLKYKQLWLADSDDTFIYDKDKGLIEKGLK